MASSPGDTGDQQRIYLRFKNECNSEHATVQFITHAKKGLLQEMLWKQ